MICRETNPIRRYVQFNDLVIDSYDMISSATYKQNSKTNVQEYSYGHGSYANFKSPQQFLTDGDLSMTINIDYRKYSRDERKFIKDFIKLNLIKAGRLWAIEDDKILWAYAFVTDFSEPYDRFKGNLSIDIELKVYEGIWHIADPRKTFLVPYSTCNFLECYDFKDYDSCDCCIECLTETDGDCASCLCHCEDLVKENTLCAVGRNVLDSFMSCTESFLLVYDCKRAEKIFEEDVWGSKICKKDICYTTISGKFYSHTILNSNNVNIRLDGKFQDPIININGTKIEIKGEYDGILKLTSSGEVLFSEQECCTFENIDLDKVIVHDEYLFTVHHGYNSVIVENACCEMACIYINVDEITY